MTHKEKQDKNCLLRDHLNGERERERERESKAERFGVREWVKERVREMTREELTPLRRQLVIGFESRHRRCCFKNLDFRIAHSKASKYNFPHNRRQTETSKLKQLMSNPIENFFLTENKGSATIFGALRCLS